jgi:hypothetical protein
VSAPTSSATTAWRSPIGCGSPVVVSTAVWCSISELISPPNKIAKAVRNSHSINTTMPLRAP